MIESGDAQEIKRDYLEILESLLKLIQHQAKLKEIQTGNDISIYASGRQVYKGVVGQSPSKNILTPSQVENINKAISDPKTSQGTILIKVGKQEVFRVQNGRLTNDKLGLAPPAQQQEVATKERTYSVESLQKQVQVLQNQLSSQQKLLDSIKQKEQEQTSEILSKLVAQVAEMSQSLSKQQQLIENTQKALSQVNERSLPPTQNTVLQNWVGTVEHQVKKTAKNIFERFQDALTPEVTKLRNEIAQLKTQINQEFTSFKSQIITQTDSVKNAVSQQIMEIQSAIDNTQTEFRTTVDNVKGKAIEESVKALIRIFGKANLDGSLSFKSSSFDFERQGENVIVRAKNGDTILQNGELSPDLSPQQLQSLDKVQSVVDKHHKLEQSARIESESVSRGIHS